jgi:hypothetical protein
MPNRNGQPSEAETQMMLFRWAEYEKARYPELELMFHVPNGGSRNAFEAKNLKLQGVKAGVPDIILPVAKGFYHGLFVELKVGKNKTSQLQEEWLDKLKGAGYKTALCYGFDETVSVIKSYLELKAGR